MKRIDYFPVVISLLLLLLVGLPYLVAFRASNAEYVFAGAFLNLQDANSYLAKMYQGWSGFWRYKLPFTAEPGQGAYLFLFYLALGHIAKIFNLTLLFTYHLARILGTVFFSIILWIFYRQMFADRFTYRLAYLIAMLGAGMGWLLVSFGYRTVDFWVAETYPFLSAFVNPHFPIGLGLMLLLFVIHSDKPFFSWSGVLQLFYALLLSIINPFGIVIVFVVLFGMAFVEYLRLRNFRIFVLNNPTIKRLFWISIGGLPVLFYNFMISKIDPVLSIWNLQNQTPSPPIWDLILSLSPGLFLAIYAVFHWKENTNLKLLIVWLVLAFVLIYFPFSLQRRFMMGLYIPVAGLAAFAITKISKASPRKRLLLTSFILALVIPTNIFILLAGFNDAYQHSPRVYLTTDDSKALTWISVSTPSDALVLAGPEMGMYIPAFTGRRVIYGHGFETINAQEEFNAVMEYFSGSMTLEQKEQFYQERGIDYLYYGPREQKIGLIDPVNDLNLVYENHKVKIYRVSGDP